MAAKLAWLTLNHNCNLRCRWCYQREMARRSTKIMPKQLARELIGLCAQIGVRNIILIGGEPTLYPRFLDLIRYIKDYGLVANVVSNSVMCADRCFVADMKVAGVDAITTSLKGSSRDEYITATGSDVFDAVRTAVANLEESKIPQQISVTVSWSTITYWDSMVDFIERCGAKLFHFSFEKPTILSDGTISFDHKMMPGSIARFVQDTMYPSLLASGVRFRIELMLPHCVLDQGFVQKLEAEGHAFGGCMLTNREGIVFDQEGHVLPCNHFVTNALGKYGIDFRTSDEFLHWKSEGEPERFRQLTRMAPGEKCAKCEQWSKCGAGCRLYWLYRGPDELLQTT